MLRPAGTIGKRSRKVSIQGRGKVLQYRDDSWKGMRVLSSYTERKEEKGLFCNKIFGIQRNETISQVVITLCNMLRNIEFFTSFRKILKMLDLVRKFACH